MSKRIWMCVGGALGFAAALVAALQWAWTPVTSRALLVLTPPRIPSRYVPAAETDLRYRTNGIMQAVLSRGQLTNLIHSLDLYPEDRQRLPMEDIVERLRKDVDLKLTGEGRLDVSVTYPDRVLAQKAAQRIVSSMIDEYTRIRSSMAGQTVDFLNDRRGHVAKRWDEASSALRVASAKGAPLDRLQLELAIARKNYEEVSAQIAEAEALKSLEERKQGPLLEMLDPASLPPDDRPEWWGVALLALAGGLTGCLLAWVVALAYNRVAAARRPAYSS